MEKVVGRSKKLFQIKLEGGYIGRDVLTPPSKHKLAVRTNHDITNTVTSAILIGVTLYGLNVYILCIIITDGIEYLT